MRSSASIRAKLLAISKREGLSFQLILLRYLHERFLYRLSISEYVENFVLKGGSFIYAVQGLSTRPTKDIDLLGKGIDKDLENLRNVLSEIVNTEYSEDFVWFNVKEMKIESIAEKNLYNGIRFVFDAGFDTIQQKVQLDIGFGDVVTPEPVFLDYPVLLPDNPVPRISAYSMETVIAEKFQAMIELATLNSRMKDFYDVYNLLTESSIDKGLLQNAIDATFRNRKTILTTDHSLFSDEFVNDAKNIKMWKAFLKKINIKEELSFQLVMKTIIHHLRTKL
jgi:predicted nucleotidyltransferase component of viral defense system